MSMFSKKNSNWKKFFFFEKHVKKTTLQKKNKENLGEIYFGKKKMFSGWWLSFGAKSATATIEKEAVSHSLQVQVDKEKEAQQHEITKEKDESKQISQINIIQEVQQNEVVEEKDEIQNNVGEESLKNVLISSVEKKSPSSSTIEKVIQEEKENQQAKTMFFEEEEKQQAKAPEEEEKHQAKEEWQTCFKEEKTSCSLLASAVMSVFTGLLETGILGHVDEIQKKNQKKKTVYSHKSIDKQNKHFNKFQSSIEQEKKRLKKLENKKKLANEQAKLRKERKQLKKLRQEEKSAEKLQNKHSDYKKNKIFIQLLKERRLKDHQTKQKKQAQKKQLCLQMEDC